MRGFFTIAAAVAIAGLTAGAALPQTPPAPAAKPQAVAPEYVPVGAAKYQTKEERAAARKKRIDCNTQAKDKNLSRSERRAFVKECLAK